MLRTKEIPFSNVPFTPDVIGIGGMITTFKSVASIIIQVRKKYNNIPVILGGGACNDSP
jgi:cobalamin-dependent methionine synthase I